ncbi:MAG: ROK family protein [Anaerolineae bacterium]|nr:ROK family protein [Anaerolineae bacterium]
MDRAIIGVDLGGTQMRAARFDPQLAIEQRLAEPTKAREGRDRVIARLLDLIARVVPGDAASLEGIGISVPGPINPHAGTVVKPPNLPGWHNVPIRQIIEERFGCPTYLGNDANVAALAEATRGAAQGYRYVLYLTVSTGIGSGILEDGRLLVGAQGLGAEAGHILMVVNGEVLDIEQVASGTAIARQAVARLRAGEPSTIRARVGDDLDSVTAKIVGQAAAEGDSLALELIQRAGFMVGLTVASLLHVFNPQIVVIGGGVSNAGELFFAPLRNAVTAHVLDPAYCEQVPIVQAALGDNVALIGAGALVTTQGGRFLWS